MLISLSGRKQSGKSTLARYLQTRYKFGELSWAEPLKEIIGRKLLGLSFEQVYGSSRDKETVDPFWGKSPRELLQLIGTECFRKQIDPDFWVKIGIKKVKQARRDEFPKEAKLVFSDTRFPNEVKAIDELMGVNIRVVREDLLAVDEHESETALDNYPFKEVISAKSGDIASLKLQLDLILSRYGLK